MTCASQEHQEILHHFWSNFDNHSASNTLQFLHLNNLFASWESSSSDIQNGDITVSLERSYYYSVLKNMDLDDNSNPTSTPSLRRPPVQQDSHLDPDHHIYRAGVGMLIWASQVRPDLQFTATDHTRHLSSPTEWDWQHLKHTLRHVKGTLHYKFLTSATSRTLATSLAVDTSSQKHLL